MIAVAALTTGKDTPSARFRARQLIPALNHRGVDVTELVPRLCPFAPNPLSSVLSTSRRTKRVSDALWTGVKAVSRFGDVYDCRQFDVVWLLKGLLPGLMTFESLIKPPLVLDVDDAIWLQHKFSKRAVPALARQADLVVVGNSWLAEHFERWSKEVVIVPTGVDTSRFVPGLGQENRRLTIGWTGTSSNLRYLYEIESALGRFIHDTGAMLLVLCDRPPQFKALPADNVRFVPWNDREEVEHIQSMDIGIMPLGREEWSYGKCALKLLTYLACGIPVVATPISANHEVLNSADVGFGAANELEWYDALKLLGSDAELRESMGSAGRKLVETDYSIEAVAPIYAALFARFVLESPAWNPSRVSNKS